MSDSAKSQASKPPASPPGASSKAGGAVGAKASPEARKLAAAILEVLAGVRSPAEAAKACGLSLPGYYASELRALGGLLTSCEPRPRGRQVSQASKMAELQRECQRLRRQCDRQQALIRLAQRSIGLSPTAPPAGKPASKQADRPQGKRKRRPRTRVLKVIAELQRPQEEGAASTAEEGGPTCQKGGNVS